MTTKLLIEIDFIKEPKKLKQLMFAIEKTAYDRAMAGGDHATNARVSLFKGIVLEVDKDDRRLMRGGLEVTRMEEMPIL
jgi:hypothetical protein